MIASKVTFNTENLNKNIEDIWCTIKAGSETLLIGCIYCPIINHFANEVSICIDQACKEYNERNLNGMLVCGDFNCSNLKWNEDGDWYFNRISDGEQEFLDVVNKNFLDQNLSVPTFQLNDQVQKSFLDLVFTESNTKITNLETGPVLGELSRGHLTMTLSYLFKNNKNFHNQFKREKKFNYKNGIYALINKFLSDIDWD
ncbi:unnamed protein product, partial [Brachionus calyciflorus]